MNVIIITFLQIKIYYFYKKRKNVSLFSWRLIEMNKKTTFKQNTKRLKKSKDE